MARISQIVLIRQPEFHALTVRGTIDFMKDFADFAGRGFDAVLSHLEGLNMLPAGEPLVCFHNADLGALDVEVGFPVSSPAEGRGEVRATTVPAQKAVSAIDMGPYEEQDPTLMELFDWVRENGHQMQGPIYYRYLNDTDRPAREYLTKMLLPLR